MSYEQILVDVITTNGLFENNYAIYILKHKTSACGSS